MTHITEKDLQSAFNLSTSEAKELANAKSFILYTYTEILVDNIKLLNSYGIGQDELRIIALNLNKFLYFNPTRNKHHLDFITNKYNLSKEELLSYILHNDSNFEEDNKKLADRISSFQTSLNLTDNTIRNLLIHTKNLGNINYQTNATKKILTLRAFGIEPNNLTSFGICDNSLDKFVLKLKLAKLNNQNLELFASASYMLGTDKIIARMKAYEMGILKDATVYSSENLIREKSGYSSQELMNMFPLTQEELEKIEEKFNLTYPAIASQLAKIENSQLSISSATEETIKETITNSNSNDDNAKLTALLLSKLYNITDEEFAKILGFYPHILTKSTNQLLLNIENITQKYDASEETIRKILINNPAAIANSYHETNNLYKYLKDVYNISPREFRNVLINGWSFFKYSFDNMHAYDESLKQICGFNQNDVAHFVLDTATTCTIDPYATNAKLKLLNMFGISIDDLINMYGQKDYNILGNNIHKIASRLKVAELASVSSKELISKHHRLSKEALTRRLIYKDKFNNDINILLINDELEENYGINDEILKQKFANYSPTELDYYVYYKYALLNPEKHNQIEQLILELNNSPLSISPTINRNTEYKAIKTAKENIVLNNFVGGDSELGEKAKKLKRYFKLSDEEIISLFESSPKLKEQATGSLLMNFATLTNIGLTPSEIILKPQVLSHEPNALKIKAAISALSGSNPKTFISTNYKYKLDKVFARYCYINGLHYKGNITYATEEKFQKEIGFDTELLTKMYPLTETNINNLLHYFEEQKNKKEDQSEK